MEFVEQDLTGARFLRCDLSDVRMRGVDVAGLDIDTPALFAASLLVNGIDVAPYVEGELNRRFPGRELRRAAEPDALRDSWAAVEAAWADAVEAAHGKEQVSVDDEWTFAQTVRHLVLATNAWLGRGIRGEEQPFHPIGVPYAEYADDGGDLSIFTEPASYAEVLRVRAEHQAQVRAFLADANSELLSEERRNPWAPDHRVDVLTCVRVILNEEWEHLRFALRDLGRASTSR